MPRAGPSSPKKPTTPKSPRNAARPKRTRKKSVEIVWPDKRPQIKPTPPNPKDPWNHPRVQRFFSRFAMRDKPVEYFPRRESLWSIHDDPNYQPPDESNKHRIELLNKERKSTHPVMDERILAVPRSATMGAWEMYLAAFIVQEKGSPDRAECAREAERAWEALDEEEKEDWEDLRHLATEIHAPRYVENDVTRMSQLVQGSFYPMVDFSLFMWYPREKLLRPDGRWKADQKALYEICFLDQQSYMDDFLPRRERYLTGTGVDEGWASLGRGHLQTWMAFVHLGNRIFSP